MTLVPVMCQGKDDFFSVTSVLPVVAFVAPAGKLNDRVIYGYHYNHHISRYHEIAPTGG